jgi:hypothetical protein
MSRSIQTGANLESWINTLASSDGIARQKARKSLVAMGKPATPSLIRALRNSKVDQVRWEAAKALGAIGDARAAPSLVKALEDKDPDVAWLAAEALANLKKAAWPALFHKLTRRGAHSALLRHGAHHVLRNQRAEGFNDLLPLLLKAFETETVPEMTPAAAYDILERMNARAEDKDSRKLGVRKPLKRRP